jgi:PTH2 family peptidyl-tRNA hydrolase
MAVKQVIVVRKDLNMRKGKLAAQVAHASMKVFFDLGQMANYNMLLPLWPAAMDWLDEGTTKIVVGVNSYDELMAVKRAARDAKLPHALIIDAGKTEFGGEPTATCIAIGPAESEKIDPITGHLPLL